MNERILVIEDNNDVRDNIVEMLELGGYQTEEAVNGKEGVKKALDNPPDLILCDIMMPEMDGYSVLYLLGKQSKTASLPFIFLTAKVEQKDIREGMNKGANDYITKPFTELELLQAIAQRLKRSKQIQQLQDKPEEQKNLIRRSSKDQWYRRSERKL